MKLNKAIQTRRSVKRFRRKTPDWRDIMEAIDAARYAPMAGDVYSLKFILVDEEKKIEKLAKYSSQDFVAQTKFVVVFISKKNRTTALYGKRGETYVRQQAGAAIQNFLLKITEKKLGTCWVGHFNEPKIKNLLKIPDDRDVEAIFPVGYEIKEPVTKKIRRELPMLLFFNQWGRNRMKKPEIVEGRWPEGY